MIFFLRYDFADNASQMSLFTHDSCSTTIWTKFDHKLISTISTGAPYKLLGTNFVYPVNMLEGLKSFKYINSVHECVDRLYWLAGF